MVAREQQEIKSEVWSLSIFWTDPSRLAKELLRCLQSEKKKSFVALDVWAVDLASASGMRGLGGISHPSFRL